MIEVRTEATSRALQRLAASLRERKRVNRQLAIQFTGWVFRNFDEEGALRLPGGWEPLSTATLLARLAKSGGSAGRKGRARSLFLEGKASAEVFAQTGVGLVKILQDTGALRGSFAPFSDNDQAGVGAQSTARHADLAVVHEEGDPSRNLPPRPMLPTPQDALEMAIETYNVFIESSRREARL